MPITPTQNVVAMRLSAALPPFFSTSVPILLHIELSDATAPSVSFPEPDPLWYAGGYLPGDARDSWASTKLVMMLFRDAMAKYMMRFRRTQQWRPPHLKNSCTWQLSRKSLMNLGEHVTCCGIRYLDMHPCDSASDPVMSDDQRRMEVRAG